jgi:hypothetical protein
MKASMSSLPRTRTALPRLRSIGRWPMPALLVWAGAWALYLAMQGNESTRAIALPAAVLAGLLPAWAWPGVAYWRRLIIAAGFPLSALGQGLGADPVIHAWLLPAWAWLLPLALLLLAYPLRAWGDAPMFPTPPDALDGLPAVVRLGQAPRLLDAGCGLGHGLEALRRAWPDARVEGIEFSAPLAWMTRWRCRFARVVRGDMWCADWSAHDLVYVFQRPETMARAYAKARRELGLGCWLASLEFPVPGVKPTEVLQAEGRKTVWLYRMGERGGAVAGARTAAVVSGPGGSMPPARSR